VRALVQRVSRASVVVEGAVIGEIADGLMILVCAMAGDDRARATALAAKVSKLRIFRDDEGRMNRSVVDSGGAALVISQFTLAADTTRGNRPGFSAPPHRPRWAKCCTRRFQTILQRSASRFSAAVLAPTWPLNWSTTGR
jgi:D-tyrosyl-tRNA(Tyr) deacylase